MDDRTAMGITAAPTSSSEALNTWALFLSMIAIVGFAMCIGSFGLDNIALSFAAGLLSLTSFVASMFFFSADAKAYVES